MWAMGPSSMILLTSTWPAAHLMVHPIPFIGSFMRVIRFRPGGGGEGEGEGKRGARSEGRGGGREERKGW